MPAAQDIIKKIQDDIASINRRISSFSGGGSLINAQYVTMALHAGLAQERVLTAGVGVDLVDGGAGGNATLSVDYLTDTREPTGFIDRSDVILAFNDGLRRLTVSPVAANFEFLYNGVRYTKAGPETIDIPNTEGVHLIYYDAAGVLQQIANPSHAQTHTAIENYCLVAYVYWDLSVGTGLIANEMHGCIMDNMTHLYLHETMSARFDDGMGLGNFTIGDGSANSHAQFSVEAGIFFDEDLEFELAAVLTATGLQIWYRDGVNWFWTTNAGYSVVTTGSGRLGYDNAGVLTEVTSGRYVLCHVFATHIGAAAPTFIAIIGQAEYINIIAARDGAETEIASLSIPGTVFKESVPIGTIIFQTSNGYGNAVKGRVVQTSTGENYIDWRTSAISAGTAAGEHGLLSGLGDDDHAQYLLIDGTRAMTGSLDIVGAGVGIHIDSSSSAFLAFDGIAGNVRDMRYQSAGLNRWIIRCDGTAEGGANAGSNFVIYSRDDAGGNIGPALFCERSTMHWIIGSTVPWADCDFALGNEGVLGLLETTTPTATGGAGKLYTKADNKLYFQDGAGTEHEVAYV